MYLIVLQQLKYKAARSSRYRDVLCKGMEQHIQAHVTVIFHPSSGFASFPAKDFRLTQSHERCDVRASLVPHLLACLHPYNYEAMYVQGR